MLTDEELEALKLDYINEPPSPQQPDILQLRSSEPMNRFRREADAMTRAREEARQERQRREDAMRRAAAASAASAAAAAAASDDRRFSNFEMEVLANLISEMRKSWRRDVAALRAELNCSKSIPDKAIDPRVKARHARARALMGRRGAVAEATSGNGPSV